MPRTRPPYPEEFRREAVELVRSSGRPVKEIAKDLGVSDQSLSNWVKRFEIDAGRAPGVTSEEREELRKAWTGSAIGSTERCSWPTTRGRRSALRCRQRPRRSLGNSLRHPRGIGRRRAQSAVGGHAAIESLIRLALSERDAAGSRSRSNKTYLFGGERRHVNVAQAEPRFQNPGALTETGSALQAVVLV